MSSRRSILGAGAALALVALVLPASVPAALADDAGTPDTTIQMAVKGETMKPVSTIVPVTAPSVVPGDVSTTEFTVLNSGPSDAKMTVDIIDVKLAEPVDDGFYDDLRIAGTPARKLAEAPANAGDGLAAGETRIVNDTVAKGSTTDFPLTYAFPYASASGNTLAPDDATVHFKLRITLQADWCPEGMENNAAGECVAVSGADPVTSCEDGKVMDENTGKCVSGGNVDPGPKPTDDPNKGKDDGKNNGGNQNGNGTNGGNGANGGGSGASSPALPWSVGDAASRLGQGIRNAMPKTGAEIAGAGTLAGGLLATGIWFLIAAKRRRDEEDEYDETAEAAMTAETIDSAEEAQR